MNFIELQNNLINLNQVSVVITSEAVSTKKPIIKIYFNSNFEEFVTLTFDGEEGRDECYEMIKNITKGE